MNRSIYFNYIEEKMNFLAFRIRQRGKINLLDLNIYSETFFADLLNQLFGYQLKNINAFKQNTEAIDLVDDENKVIVQVTSTCTKAKVEKSLSKEILKDYSSYRFIFVIISEDAGNLRKQAYHNPHQVLFSAENDIWDIKSILDHILNMEIEKMKELYIFIRKELGEELVPEKTDSNLSLILKILSEENLADELDVPQINSFEINKKIEYNELSGIKELIDEYKVYYGRLNELYTEFDKQGANRSLSVLNTVRQYYFKLSIQRKNPEEIFFSIVGQLIGFVKGSRNCPDICYEELEMCIYIVVIDAFIKCKIFKNPEGYSYVASR